MADLKYVIYMKEEHQIHNKDAENRIIEDVNKYGWHVALFEADNYLPTFGYTIGLWKSFTHPEIITFALNVETIYTILNIAGNLIKNGNTIKPYNKYANYLNNLDVQFINVLDDNLKDWFGYGLWFNKNNKFPALQLIWPDKNNLFPWEDEFNTQYLLNQPLLDRNSNFKFFESKNLAVFTTRQVMFQNYPILEVYHDKEDGAWQFLCGTTTDPKDLLVVCLEEVIKKDLSLNELFYLELGKSANRKSLKDKWIIEVSDDENE
jgi:hypothetical protein